MKGWILSFRLGRKRYYPRQVIIEVENPVGPHQLIGRKVVWVHPKGKKFIGKIVREHGNRGTRFIAYFRRQLPGIALGSEVNIV